ncbi:hypothetical protein FUA48_07585 [Flavobacterium alkalisoli]|uniref:Carboxypeptidase regulatory-like domain-containing protein n=2 Tax=Flavobacterium alkalisoli TaxID=2602769 RepID=A0A5B9FUV3_9FLAO|nr:hypothetical protein FUA48_07585 [Flavobacterium alkalisoli]
MPGKYFKNIMVAAFLLSGFISMAQKGNFTIEFTQQNSDAKNTGIIDAFVKIKNTSGNSVTGEFDVHSNHEDLYLVQRKPKPITLQGRDSVFIPVKAIISNTAKAGSEPSIEAVFTTTEGTSENVTLPITIKERKLVKMFLLETNLIYENIGDSLTIPIRISNDGNTDQKINIVTRYPNFIAKDMMESETVKVRAFTDTLINLKKIVNKTILSQEDFSITITTLYQSGDIIGISNVTASSIKQDRRYSTQFSPEYAQSFNRSNQVSASYLQNSSGGTAYYLYANAEAEINNSTIYTNIDANLWTNTNQLFLRNTWLGYKNKTMGVLAGNISKFSDINLVGRGAQAYYNTSENSKIEVGSIDKSYNLADFSIPSGGTSAWASYYHKGGWLDKGFESSLIYDNDKFSGFTNYLITSRFNVFQKKHLSLRAGGGLSSVNNEVTGENKTGGTVDMVATGRYKNFFYNSTNYLSSGYYAGVRKGVFSLNERLNWVKENYNFWALYNYISVDPKSFSDQLFYPSQFSTSRYNIGASRRINKLTVSLSPYLYKEKRRESLFGNTPQDYTLDATRANVGLIFNNVSSSLSLTFEGGIFNSNADPISNQFHFKTNLIYNWKFLNILTTYQHNYFNLGEIIANQQLNNDKTFYNVMFNPSAVLKFFDSKLVLYTGATLASNLFTDRITQLNGRADYRLSPDFSIFANGYYSDISNNPYAINSFQVGLTKQFRPIRIDSSKSDLEVYVYYETNGKGPEDTHNTPVANQLVIISGKAFRTNDQGIIKYRHLPPGDYEVRPVNSNEWHAYSRTVNVIQDTKVAIGLTKTSTIKGSVTYIETERSFEITKKKSGLSIIAIDDSGNVFQTRTDDTGNFILYVPKGGYTLTLEKAGVSEYVEVENNNRTVDAVPDTTTQVKFNLNIKEKRIETRKFTSRGFPSQSTGDDSDKKKKKKK